MAKMFYTLEEAKGALGRGEEEIKQFARDGRLREFRDGPRLMFKADQVEQLRSELGGMDAVALGVSDSGGMINLVDPTGASGTSIPLADAGDTAAGSDLGGMSGGTSGGTAIPFADRGGTGSGSMAGSGSGSGSSGL